MLLFFYAKFKFCVEKYIYKNSKIAEKGLAGGLKNTLKTKHSEPPTF